MPNHLQWNPGYNVGNEILDDQHRKLLEQCNTLGDCIADAGQQRVPEFDSKFKTLMALAGEHFTTEEALLTQCGYPKLEEHQNERDEFNYLVSEIVTPDNFDPVELQRFLGLWWVGHIVGSGKQYRAFLEKLPPGAVQLGV